MTRNGASDEFLSGKQLKAVGALIACDSVEEACTTCGIARSTMYRYLQDPVFDRELKAAKRQLFDQAILRLQQSCVDASNALAEICRNKAAPPSARVAAAREILRSSLQAIEIEDLEERLKKLERFMVN